MPPTHTPTSSSDTLRDIPSKPIPIPRPKTKSPVYTPLSSIDTLVDTASELPKTPNAKTMSPILTPGSSIDTVSSILDNTPTGSVYEIPWVFAPDPPKRPAQETFPKIHGLTTPHVTMAEVQDQIIAEMQENIKTLREQIKAHESELEEMVVRLKEAVAAEKSFRETTKAQNIDKQRVKKWLKEKYGSWGKEGARVGD